MFEFFISFCLGMGFSFAVAPLLLGKLDLMPKINIFVSSCSLYHFTEYLYKCSYHHWDVSWHDFLLDYSLDYAVAMFVCLVEYFSRLAYFKTLMRSGTQEFEGFQWVVVMVCRSECSRYLSGVGMAMVLVGHYFRIHAMFHAKSNFNHLI